MNTNQDILQQDKLRYPNKKTIHEFLPDSKYRILPFIGLQTVNMGYMSGIGLIFYLLYQILYKRSAKHLIFYLIIQIYTLYFCKRSETFLKFIRFLKTHKWYNSYKIVAVEGSIEQNSTIYPFMPHNVLAFPLLQLFSLKQHPFNSVPLGTRVAVESPIVGTISKWLGVRTIDAKNFKKMMSNKENLLFVPGGFEEATFTSHKQYRFLADRFGFIKYALQFGYNICPVIIFQENKGYWTTDIGMKYRLLMNKIKMPGVFFFSKYLMIPDKNIDVTMLVGRRMQMPKIENPTKEEVKQYHNEYLREIKELFDNNVDLYDKGATLQFWTTDGKVIKDY